MEKVAYYVTGHGYGHATRSIELMRGLVASGKYDVTTVSSLEPSFFESEMSGYVDLGVFHARHKCLDTGGVQLDAIRLDPLKTLESYHDTIHIRRSELLAEEVEWVKEQKIGFILIDATPLASAIGRAAGVKSIYVTNFTWDYIFDTMFGMVLSDTSNSISAIKLHEMYDSMLEQCRRDSGDCDYVINYPGQCPMNSYIDPAKIIAGPMICRQIKNRNLRVELGVSTDEKMLLLGFGGHTAEWNLKDEHLPPGWKCFVLRADPRLMPSDRFQVLPQESYVPDLAFAADVVLGKIGYGFVSECVNAGTPLVYVPRVAWSEELFLENMLKDLNAGLAIPFSDFHEGNWQPYLDKAYAMRRSWTIDSSSWAVPGDATASVIKMIETYLAG